MIIFAVGVFSFNVIYSAENSQKTEKIKIVSAYCVNNKWIFRIHDGVTGQTFSLKLGKPNSQGWSVESFDQEKQIAIIASPRGYFEVLMQESKLSEPEKNIQKIPPSENTEKNVISRKDILDRIK